MIEYIISKKYAHDVKDDDEGSGNNFHMKASRDWR